MASLDHADRIARTQHGLVVMQQLYECGLTRRQVQGLVGHGALIRMRRGIYRMSGSPVTWEQALLAATLSAGPRAVASHSSAARL
jgi:predicted transcriptional regulator of viral defense system